MGTPAAAAVAGLRENDLHIDGTQLSLPAQLTVTPTIRQVISTTLSSRGRVDAWYDGDALPDQPDHYDFSLQWWISDQYASELSFLADLAVAGGTHTLAYWKAIRTRYTAKSGQQYFYLPRPDAFSKQYTGHTTQSVYGAVVSVNGAPLSIGNTQYKTTVLTSDVVTGGQVWISNTAVSHPDAGYTVALFKFGTALNSGDVVSVEYYPLFNVAVLALQTAPFTQQTVGREDKQLQLTETN